MNALASFTPEMFTAMRRIGNRVVTAHELGVSGFTMARLADAGFLLADRERSPALYSPTPMGLGAVAVLTSPPSPVEHEGTVKRVQRLAAHRFGVAEASMTSSRREGPAALARQVAMYAARELTPLSYPALGRRFNRDHTTIIYGCKKVARMMAEDASFAAKVRGIMREAVK